MTNEQTMTIEEELRLVHQDDPDFLAYFLTLMETGKIHGENYGDLVIGRVATFTEQCTCFYGHRFRDKADRMEHTWFVRQRISGDGMAYTPVEELIRNVEPGETPEDNEALFTLKAAIEHILLSVTI